MAKETENTAAGSGEDKLLDMMQWVWLVLGVVFALIGGIEKVRDVYLSPAVFQYVFFSGFFYILLVGGLALIVMGLGYDLIFGPVQE